MAGIRETGDGRRTKKSIGVRTTNQAACHRENSIQFLFTSEEVVSPKLTRFVRDVE